MNELLQKLINEVGLTPEQAHKSADVFKDFIKSKVPPAFSGMIDNFLQGDGLNAFMAQAKEKAAGFAHDAAEKVEDLKEDAKENFAEFRAEAKEEFKEASEKADKLANEALHKIKDLFGGNKAD